MNRPTTATTVSRQTAVLLLLITVVLWSTSGLFIKLSTLNPIALAGGRSLITAGVLWIYLRRPHFSWSREQVIGAICIALTFMLFITATKWTSAANAIFLQYTAPLWVVLFSGWYLGEKARPTDWWIMGAIVAGMALFFGERLSAQGTAGNVLAIASGVTMAWMTLLLRKQGGDAANTILLGNLLTAAIGVPFLAGAAARGEVPVVEWGILLYMGVLQLGLPFVLYSIALRSLSAVETILIATLEPILNPIWVFLFLGERPAPLALIGGAVVVGAVTLRSLLSSGVMRLGRAAPAPDLLPPLTAGVITSPPLTDEPPAGEFDGMEGAVREATLS